MRTGHPLRVALIGAGMISRHHLIAWDRCASAEVIALADPNAQAAADRAAEFGIAATFSGAEALLEAVDVDAIDIAAPMDRHAPICRAAMDRGIDILCQKPLCPSLAEAEALVAKIGDAVRLMVHENWRFRTPYRRIADWLADGSVGEPRAFTLEVMGSGLITDRADEPPPALRRQPFMADMARMTVLESLIHHLDTLRWLLGGLQVVDARTARLSDHVVGEDTAMLLLQSQNGAIGTLSASMSVHGQPARTADRLKIIASDGTIDFADWTLTRSGGGPIVYDPDEVYQASFDAVIAHFAACLASGDPFETPCRENLATLALVEDVYRAATHSTP